MTWLPCGVNGQKWKLDMSTYQHILHHVWFVRSIVIKTISTKLIFYFRNYEAALKLMQKAVTPTSVKAAYHDSSEIVQNRVYKSLKVWSMYADLEESFGTFKVCLCLNRNFVACYFAAQVIKFKQWDRLK